MGCTTWIGAKVLGVTLGLAFSNKLPAEPASVLFQQGQDGFVGTVDTFLKGSSPDTSQGTLTVVEWDGSDGGGQNIGLLRFDDIFGTAPGRIPPESIILAAELAYYVGNSGNDGTVNEVLVDWDENTTYNAFGGEPGVQVDEYGTIVGTAAGGAGEQSLDVTASVATWSADAALNRGWIFRPTGGTDGVEFYSSEHGTVASRPSLQVTYLHLVDEVGIYPAQIDTVVGSADLQVLVAIPPGSNDSAPVNVTLTTDDASVAVPVGATGDSLVIIFPVGAPTQQAVSVDIGQAGAASLTTSNDAGLQDATLTANVSVGAVSFEPASLTSLEAFDVTVQVCITPGSNDTRSVAVTLTSDDVSVAVPAGATGGSLALTFDQGGPSTQPVPMGVGNTGNTVLTTANDGGLDDAELPVLVMNGFMFSATSDMRSYTAPGQFPLVLDEITATGGPGVFMICPGDIDPPQNVDAALDAEFGANFDWYPIVGNHEAETPADMDWIRNEFANLPHIVNTGPPGTVETTYSFNFGNTHFAVLNEYYDGTTDTGTDGDVVPTLRDWLEADLLANTRKWVFVVGHEPAYPQPDVHWGDARHVGDSLDQYPTNRDAFWTTTAAHHVAAYLTAHTHRYSRCLEEGVWQIDTGEARGAGKYDTFLRVLVGNDQIAVHVYRSLDTGTFRLVDLLNIGPFNGDCDRDGDTDLADFGSLAACLGGPGAGIGAGCGCFDLDGNEDIDLLDYAGFQSAFTGGEE
jgi:hypothetical protein